MILSISQNATCFEDFNGSQCNISRDIIKKCRFRKISCISNPSLKRRQWLLKGAKKVTWLFGIVEKPFKFLLRWLLYSAMIVVELIFFCFPIFSAWKLSWTLLGFS